MLSILDAITQLQSTSDQFYKYLIKKYDVQVAHIRLLFILTNQPANFADLVAQTELDYSTISRQVTAMEKNNLVTISTKEDKRHKLISLSPLAEEKVLAIQKEKNELEKQLFANWPDDERQLLMVLINRCLRSLERLDFSKPNFLDLSGFKTVEDTEE